MSLQGPLIVVADQPAAGLVEALSAAGAFPIVEAKWADAPTAFVAVKPAGVVIAEPGPPPRESAARMLCLQIATVNGPLVPTIALADDAHDAAHSAGAAGRCRPAGRGRDRAPAIGACACARCTRPCCGASNCPPRKAARLPQLPVSDALDDATVLIVGRGPLYPALSVAVGERVKMIGALSVETAAKYLKARDIDGIVVGDGFPPRMVEAFLSLLAQDTRFRDLPVAVIGEAPDGFGEALPNIDHVDGDAERLVARMVPLVRLHAFEARLKRMLKSLDTGGMIDRETGLLTQDAFCRELGQAVADAADRSQALSLARFSFDGPLDARASLDAARLVSRLVRTIDFASREDDGSILIAFPHSDLRSAHVVARRIAVRLKNTMLAPDRAHERSPPM